MKVINRRLFEFIIEDLKKKICEEICEEVCEEKA